MSFKPTRSISYSVLTIRHLNLPYWKGIRVDIIHKGHPKLAKVNSESAISHTISYGSGAGGGKYHKVYILVPTSYRTFILRGGETSKK